jgi:outer membrane murein-binding lipoprotein Lpp
MRFVARLLPCAVVVAALMLSGCGSPNAKMASLERENTRLQAEKQKLTMELATLRTKLNAADAQTKHWESICGSTQKQIRAHIDELAQAQIRRQIVQQALALAQTQLEAASKGQKNAAALAEQTLRVARATTEEPPARPR